jgi:ABC-type dipeptide/oligopeptide/nickel transport system permease component
MKDSVRTVLWVLLAVFMVLTFYAIFNAGNPNSLFRLIVEDPGYDVLITLILGACIFVLAIALTAGRKSTIQHLLEINKDYIRQLRSKGRSDVEIADSFLSEMGSKGGLLHGLAKRRVLRYLSKL